jgi:hypothetical protein
MWDGDKFGGFPGNGEIFQHMAKVKLGRKYLCEREGVA